MLRYVYHLISLSPTTWFANACPIYFVGESHRVCDGCYHTYDDAACKPSRSVIMFMALRTSNFRLSQVCGGAAS